MAIAKSHEDIKTLCITIFVAVIQVPPLYFFQRMKVIQQKMTCRDWARTSDVAETAFEVQKMPSRPGPPGRR